MQEEKQIFPVPALTNSAGISPVFCATLQSGHFWLHWAAERFLCRP